MVLSQTGTSCSLLALHLLLFPCIFRLVREYTLELKVSYQRLVDVILQLPTQDGFHRPTIGVLFRGRFSEYLTQYNQ